MVPGVYAFEMIVLFNRGQMLEAVQASASCGFVIGALAMGLGVRAPVQPAIGGRPPLDQSRAWETRSSS